MNYDEFLEKVFWAAEARLEMIKESDCPCWVSFSGNVARRKKKDHWERLLLGEVGWVWHRIKLKDEYFLEHQYIPINDYP